MGSDRELRASIAAIGPLLPVLIWENEVLDGRKRQAICEELGLMPRVLQLHSLPDACRALWTLHPERAVALAATEWQGIKPSLTTIAELCGVRVAAVAVLMTDGVVRKPDKRSPRRTRSKKTLLIQLWADEQFKHYVKAAGELEGLDLSSTIRVACWEYVQRINPRAATEGSERGPAIALVRPPERRRYRGP